MLTNTHAAEKVSNIHLRKQNKSLEVIMCLFPSLSSFCTPHAAVVPGAHPPLSRLNVWPAGTPTYLFSILLLRLLLFCSAFIPVAFTCMQISHFTSGVDAINHRLLHRQEWCVLEKWNTAEINNHLQISSNHQWAKTTLTKCWNRNDPSKFSSYFFSLSLPSCSYFLPVLHAFPLH